MVGLRRLSHRRLREWRRLCPLLLRRRHPERCRMRGVPTRGVPPPVSIGVALQERRRSPQHWDEGEEGTVGLGREATEGGWGGGDPGRAATVLVCQV